MRTVLALLAVALLALPLLALASGCSERRVERHEQIRHESEPTPIVVPDNGSSRIQSQNITGGTSSSNGERRIERYEKTITEETTPIVVPD